MVDYRISPLPNAFVYNGWRRWAKLKEIFNLVCLARWKAALSPGIARTMLPRITVSTETCDLSFQTGASFAKHESLVFHSLFTSRISRTLVARGIIVPWKKEPFVINIPRKIRHTRGWVSLSEIQLQMKLILVMTHCWCCLPYQPVNTCCCLLISVTHRYMRSCRNGRYVWMPLDMHDEEKKRYATQDRRSERTKEQVDDDSTGWIFPTDGI